MNEEEGVEQWVPEDQVRSLEADFWRVKQKAVEAKTWKACTMFTKLAIIRGLALTDHEEHRAYREGIGHRMDKLDMDKSEAANWIDKGWGYENYEESYNEDNTDNYGVILSDVETFLVSIGRIAAQEPDSPERLEHELEMEYLRDEIMKVQMAREADDGEAKEDST